MEANTAAERSMASGWEHLRALTGHSGEVNCCAWSPNGALLVSGSDDTTLRLWTREGEPVRTLTGHSHYVFCCAWSPDGALLASGSNDNTLRLWHDPLAKKAVNVPKTDPASSPVAIGKGCHFFLILVFLALILFRYI